MVTIKYQKLLINMHNKTVSELQEDLKNKKVSSVELTKHFLDRIKKIDSELNSFITITEDEVRNIKIFYVWIAKTLNKPTGLIELKNIWKSLETLGKQSGCSTIETSTPIRRVGRYLEKTGWTLKTLEYTKDI